MFRGIMEFIKELSLMQTPGVNNFDVQLVSSDEHKFPSFYLWQDKYIGAIAFHTPGIREKLIWWAGGMHVSASLLELFLDIIFFL